VLGKAGPEFEIRGIFEIFLEASGSLPKTSAPKTAFLLNKSISSFSTSVEKASPNHWAGKGPKSIDPMDNTILNRREPPRDPIDAWKLQKDRSHYPQGPRQINIVTVEPSKNLTRSFRESLI
jgi:hypothetical protein